MPSLALFSRFQDRSSWGLESSGSWVRGELLRTLASRSIAPCAVIASNGSWTPANGIAPAVASSGYERPSHSLTRDLQAVRRATARECRHQEQFERCRSRENPDLRGGRADPCDRNASRDFGGPPFRGLNRLLGDVYLRDRDGRRESEFAGEDDGLRNAVRHDDRVDFLRHIGGHLAPGRPTLHERPRIPFPEEVPFDLDQADDRFGRMVVCGETEVDGRCTVSELGDQGDRTVVVDSQVHPTVGGLHEPSTVDAGELERLDGHGFSGSKGPTLFERSRERGF